MKFNDYLRFIFIWAGQMAQADGLNGFRRMAQNQFLTLNLVGPGGFDRTLNGKNINIAANSWR